MINVLSDVKGALMRGRSQKPNNPADKLKSTEYTNQKSREEGRNPSVTRREFLKLGIAATFIAGAGQHSWARNERRDAIPQAGAYRRGCVAHRLGRISYRKTIRREREYTHHPHRD